MPWVLLAGIFQQSFWKFFPLKRFFSGPEFWDWITVVDLYVLLLIAVLLIGLVVGKIKFVVRKIPWELAAGIVLILIAGVLEMLYQKTYTPILSTPFLYFRSLFVLPIILVLLMVKTMEKDDLEKLTRQYLYMAGLFSFLALIQYFSGIFPGERYDFMQRLSWPFIDFITLKATSANWAAFMVTPAVVIGLARMGNWVKEQKHKGLWSKEKCPGKCVLSLWKNFTEGSKAELMILVLSLATLYLTQSYGAYAAVFGALTLYFFRLLPLKKFAAVLVMMLLFAGGVFLIQKNSYKFSVLSGEKQYRYENSAESRKDIYMMNLQMIKDHPLLGVGLNQYQSYFASTSEKTLGHKFNESHVPPHAHNFFLSMWLSLGILGLVGMLLVVAGALIRSKFAVINAAAFALTAMMIHGMIDSYYWKQEIAYLFWIVVMLAYATTADGKKNS